MPNSELVDRSQDPSLSRDLGLDDVSELDLIVVHHGLGDDHGHAGLRAPGLTGAHRHVGGTGVLDHNVRGVVLGRRDDLDLGLNMV